MLQIYQPMYPNIMLFKSNPTAEDHHLTKLYSKLAPPRGIEPRFLE